MNILTLFNGIGGLPLACDRAGINFNNCYYSEIDKYANKVMEKHYPDAIALGDVTKWREWNIDWASIDLVGAGFPCQAWSVAGQQLGDKDERGMLFWTTLEIIKHVLYFNPKAKFLMENVKMKKDFEEYITHHTTQALGYVEKILINSALVSAQNRNRYYWTNFEVSQPDDKGIYLKDIIQSHTDAKFNLSSEAIDYMGRLRNGKPRWEYHKNPINGKAACLTANMYKGVPYGVLQIKNESATKDNKAYSLTASYGGAVAWNSCQKKQRTMIPVENSNTENPNQYNGVLYRKLTPIECERLQTLPDNWTDCISNTQRYKSIGNGWTIDVIAHILKCMEVNKLKDCA